MTSQNQETSSQESSTIEKVLAPQSFRIFDSHAHPGLEKKGIAGRPGCLEMWLGNWITSRTLMGARAALGDPEPTKILTKAEECPEFSPETWISIMDASGVEAMNLQCIHGITDPYPGNKEGWKWYVPNEYVKKEFIDAYPGRFTAVGGVHARYGKQAAVEMVISAHENGFPGIKIHTPTSGYPNNPDLYPAYEKCQELGLHIEIHTGVEELPGTRAKYQDPVHVDDVAMDFPDVKILQLHCGAFNNPSMGLWNVIKHENVYTDITVPHPTLMRFKYYWDLDHMRFLEYFMPDKVFFGTDFPLLLSVYKCSIDHILNLPLSQEFKKKLMGDNFRKFLGWKNGR
jgi:predicted TIM-barrel fold metal-dependent hydrolase